MCNGYWAYDLEFPPLVSVMDHGTKGKQKFSLQKPAWLKRQCGIMKRTQSWDLDRLGFESYHILPV